MKVACADTRIDFEILHKTSQWQTSVPSWRSFRREIMGVIIQGGGGENKTLSCMDQCFVYKFKNLRSSWSFIFAGECIHLARTSDQTSMSTLNH
jgi:hypothetical protein